MKINPLDPHQGVPVFGATRTRIASRHALVSSDGFVPSHWPGARNTEVVFHISPAMGAGFVQAGLAWRGNGFLPLPSCPERERFLYLTAGSIRVSGARDVTLTAGSFLYLPPGASLELAAEDGAEAAFFEKRYEPLPDTGAPGVLFGRAADFEEVPFLGNEGARLRTLLPDEPAFDMAVNLFTYDPGAFLPFVETHIMEHGLLMLSGHGVYRLDDAWYPVRSGDVIWMAPHCPQWFVAMGDHPASYLYYKNVNRLPFV